MDNPVKDRNYDLISSIYHLAHGSEMAKQYSQDAQKNDDKDAAEFFDNLQRMYTEHGDKGAKILKERL